MVLVVGEFDVVVEIDEEFFIWFVEVFLEEGFCGVFFGEVLGEFIEGGFVLVFLIVEV